MRLRDIDKCQKRSFASSYRDDRKSQQFIR